MKHRRTQGFSLLELMTVIAIMVIIMTGLTMSVTGFMRSHQLTKGASLVKDHLVLARQMAISGNVHVTFNLCRVPAGPTGTYSAIFLSKVGPTGDPIPITGLLRFPPNILVTEDESWSNLMTTPTETVTAPGVNAPIEAKQIVFRPSGGMTTDYTNTTQCFFTVFYSTDAAAVPDTSTNFVTMDINPITGRIISYQP